MSSSALAHNSCQALALRIIPYEGATLHSAHLDLMQAGELQGEIVVSFTDSGTVTDTMLVTGSWERDHDTVRFTYRYSKARWQGGPRMFEPARKVAGLLQGSELTLPELASFDQHFFGEPTPLHFRRVG